MFQKVLVLSGRGSSGGWSKSQVVASSATIWRCCNSIPRWRRHRNISQLILGTTPTSTTPGSWLAVGLDVEVKEEQKLCGEVDEARPLDSEVVVTPREQVVGDDHQYDQKLHLLKWLRYGLAEVGKWKGYSHSVQDFQISTWYQNFTPMKSVRFDGIMIFNGKISRWFWFQRKISDYVYFSVSVWCSRCNQTTTHWAAHIECQQLFGGSYGHTHSTKWILSNPATLGPIKVFWFQGWSCIYFWDFSKWPEYRGWPHSRSPD